MVKIKNQVKQAGIAYILYKETSIDNILIKYKNIKEKKSIFLTHKKD